jgi:hypothetical protein
MNFTRIDFPASQLRSLAWDGDTLVDWVGGARYRLDGTCEKLNVGYAFRFDAAVGLGRCGVSFEARGTKGRLLRDNGRRPTGNIVPLSVDIVREIDRSYYRATDYYYPVTLFRLADGRLVIAHCPRGYNRLDVEEFEGGCLTPRPIEGSVDIFHARLEASLDGRWLISNGWVWTPWRGVFVYDVAKALAQPSYLSTAGETLALGEGSEWEVEGATFLGHRIVCVTNEEKAALTIYDLDMRRHEHLIELREPPGTRLMPAGDDHVVLFDGQPRLRRDRRALGRPRRRRGHSSAKCQVEAPGATLARDGPSS